MRGNFHDNSDKNHIFKSMLFSKKDEEENNYQNQNLYPY